MLDLKRDNVLQFNKGFDSGMDGEGPWILRQELGAIIVVKDMDPQHQKDFTLGVFTIVHKTDKSVRIANPQRQIDERVDPIRFCKRFSLVEVLGIVDLESVSHGEESDTEE